MLLSKRSSWTQFAIVVGIVTLSIAAFASTATACDPCCRLKKVVVIQCKQVPYQVCVTKYDHCGNPYHAYVTQYRTVHVPVTKWVKVCD